MNRDQIIATLKDLLRQQKELNADIDSISETTPLDKIGFDSISILDFMYDVEAKFNVQTEIADLVKMEVVKDLIDYLDAKTSG